MSFIQLTGINDVKELAAASEGRYSVVITQVDMHEKEDKSSIRVVLEIEDGANKYASIFHYIGLPDGKDGAKDQTKLLMAKRFMTQFHIPFEDGVDLEAFVGNRADCNLGVEEYQGQIKNVLKIDRLPNEG